MATKKLWVIGLSALLAFSALAVSNTSSVSRTNKQDPQGVSFSVIITGESAGSLESMVVADGSWLTVRKLVHAAVLIKHPKGNLLWDSGLGREVDAQMESFSWFQKQLFKVVSINPAVDQLEQQGFDIQNLKAIIPSHMHWDHVSGIEDFPGVPVWVQKREHSQAFKGKAPEFIRSQFDSPDLLWEFISLKDQPYKGFERSLDIYGDGTLVLVDLSGHTLGQLGLFLKGSDGKDYFFIGDTAWAQKGVELNRGRPVFVDWAVGVDTDKDKNAQRLHAIHRLAKASPNLVVVPAHDEIVNRSLPVYPEFL